MLRGRPIADSDCFIYNKIGRNNEIAGRGKEGCFLIEETWARGFASPPGDDDYEED